MPPLSLLTLPSAICALALSGGRLQAGSDTTLLLLLFAGVALPFEMIIPALAQLFAALSVCTSVGARGPSLFEWFVSDKSLGDGVLDTSQIFLGFADSARFTALEQLSEPDRLLFTTACLARAFALVFIAISASLAVPELCFTPVRFLALAIAARHFRV